MCNRILALRGGFQEPAWVVRRVLASSGRGVPSKHECPAEGPKRRGGPGESPGPPRRGRTEGPARYGRTAVTALRASPMPPARAVRAATITTVITARTTAYSAIVWPRSSLSLAQSHVYRLVIACTSLLQPWGVLSDTSCIAAAEGPGD